MSGLNQTINLVAIGIVVIDRASWARRRGLGQEVLPGCNNLGTVGQGIRRRLAIVAVAIVLGRAHRGAGLSEPRPRAGPLQRDKSSAERGMGVPMTE